MLIFVKQCDGKTYTVRGIEPSDTIEILNTKIEVKKFFFLFIKKIYNIY